MIIFWLCVVLAGLGLLAAVLQVLAVRSAVRAQRTKKTHPSSWPPISILKPLKGLDDNLFDNLESFCHLDYPEYEIIFALQDHNDPACKIARKIRDKHPDRNITVLVERCSQGLNPKVNNLIPACRAARYDAILISDSNVLVGRNYLRETARHLEDPEVGLVTSLIRGIGGRTLGAALENIHLNTFIAGSVCLLDRFLKMPCVIGKSMLMRKKDLEAIGGLPAVKDVLAEDYIIGREMHAAGKKVALSTHFVNNVNQHWGVKRFLGRHIRWGKLRWKIGGVRYLSELLLNPVFMACLPILVSGPSLRTVSLALLASFLKTALDLSLRSWTDAGSGILPYLLVPVKDLLIGCAWFVPVLSDTIVWRGNRYLIGRDSRLAPVPETGVGSWRYRVTNVIRERFA